MPPKKQKDSKEVTALVEALKAVVTKDSAKPATSNKKKKKQRNKGQGTAQIRFSRTEFVTTLTLPATKTLVGKVPINPIKGPPILAKIAEAFSRSRWERVNFFYKPLVGAMYSGAITMGVLWESGDEPKSRADVAALSPTQTIPLREDGESKPLKISAEKMKARSWYNHEDSETGVAQPGTLWYAVTGEKPGDVGELHMVYTVVLDGPHA